MPGRKPTLELFQALTDAFREQPGNASYAARIAGCDRRLAKNAWEKGWPHIKHPPWAADVNRSIRDRLEDEKVAVRARLADEEAQRARDAAGARDEVERARRDALDQKAKEARAARAALDSGMGLLGIASALASALVPTVQRLGEQLRKKDEANETMSLKEVISTIRKLAYVGQVSTNIIGRAMELDRKRLGEPEAILGVHAETHESDKAVAMLGSEAAVWEAIEDLKAGRITERAQKLLELHGSVH